MAATVTSDQAPQTSDQDRKRLNELKDRYDQAKAFRRPFETEWYLNLAFYDGKQWLAFARGKFSRPRLERWRVLFTDNRVQPIVRTEVAKMTKHRPSWAATPTTADEQALQDAIMSERLLDSGWDRIDAQRKFRLAILWSRLCGAGYWKISWDRSVGQGVDVLVGGDGKPLVNEQTGQVYRASDVPQEILQEFGDQVRVESMNPGEVRLDVRSPLDLYPDPLGNDEGVSSLRWMIDEAVRSPEEVLERYGVEVKPDTAATPGSADALMPTWQDAGGAGKKLTGVRVFEMFERPSKTHKKGRHCVWTDKALLVDEDNDTDDHGLPYVMFVGIPVPGRYHPTCTASQIRPLNAELNKTRSQTRENAARFGNPTLLIPREIMQTTKIHGVPGEQVPFDSASQNLPQYMTPPSMPGYVQNEPALIENSMREVSGQHEVSQAQVPSGVTAAAAINLLQEQDDTRLGPDVWDMERALSVAGQMILRLMAAYYRTDRIVAICGEDGAWDISSFRSEMLSSVPDVQVQPGSMIPQSIAAKQAAMRDYLQLFLQMGVPMSAYDLGRFLRGVGVGALDRLVAGFSQDDAQISRENMLLLAGQPVEINEFDNDPAHLAGHAEVLKSRRFQLLDPPARQNFLMHWMAHKQRMDMQAQQQAAAMMGMAPGGPGPAPALPPGMVGADPGGPGGAQGPAVIT